MSEEYLDAMAFTGHRPDKYPLLQDEESKDAKLLKWAIQTHIEASAFAGCRDFYMGCGEGADVIFGELVLAARETTREGLRLICVPPFIGYEKRLPEPWRSRCERLLRAADEVVDLGHAYFRGCFHARNRYMVDHAADLLAIYNGTPGGTAYTIREAVKKNRSVTIIHVHGGRVWRTVNEIVPEDLQL